LLEDDLSKVYFSLQNKKIVLGNDVDGIGAGIIP